MLWIPALSVDPLCVCAQSRRVQFCASLWTVACWALLSMGFSRQEYRNGLPHPLPGDLPNPGVPNEYVLNKWANQYTSEWRNEDLSPEYLPRARSKKHTEISQLCEGWVLNDILQMPSNYRGSPRADYLYGAEKDLHALSCQEGLPARPELGNTLEAEQKRPADQNEGIGRVVAVPILMQPEQTGDVASVHCPAAVRLWNQRENATSVKGSPGHTPLRMPQCACMLNPLSYVRLFATPWPIAHQAPLSMGFSRQEYWHELPCPPLRGLPLPGNTNLP